jgi:hypothetical protein
MNFKAESAGTTTVTLTYYANFVASTTGGTCATLGCNYYTPAQKDYTWHLYTETFTVTVTDPHTHTPADTWTIAEDGTHVKVCTDCNEVVDSHDPAGEKISYTDNGDEKTHTGTYECGLVKDAEAAHVDADNDKVCDDCGATINTEPTETAMIVVRVSKVGDTDVTDPAWDNNQTVHTDDIITVDVVALTNVANASVHLTYDADKLELQSAPADKDGWIAEDGGYFYAGVASGLDNYLKGTLGTFTFKVTATGANTAANVYLTEGKASTIHNVGGAATPDATTKNTYVRIQGTLDPTVNGVDGLTYTGDPQTLVTVANLPNGVTPAITWTVKGPDGNTVTVTSTDTTGLPTGTAAGEYEITYKIEVDGYDPVEVTIPITVTIGKAEITATATGVDTVYDGATHQIGVTVATPASGTTIQYTTTVNSEGNPNGWSDTNPEFTDVTNTTVWYKVSTGDGNYKDLIDNTTVMIAKKDITLTVNNVTVLVGQPLSEDALTYTITYEGVDENGNTVTVTDNNLLGTVTLSCAYDPNVDTTADTIDIAATYTENSNYNVNYTKGTLTIAAPDIEVTQYVNGYALVLVGTNADAKFNFNGNAMYDVTGESVNGVKYNVNGNDYAHVYATIVEVTETDKQVAGLTGGEDVAGILAALKPHYLAKYVRANATDVAGTIAYTYDVNGSNTTDLNDATFTDTVYCTYAEYLTGDYVTNALLADVNHDKKVNSEDVSMIVAEYVKNNTRSSTNSTTDPVTEPAAGSESNSEPAEQA